MLQLRPATGRRPSRAPEPSGKRAAVRLGSACRRTAGALPLLLAGLALSCLAWAPSARAQIGSDRYAAIVLEAGRGTVLVAANADEPRYPASLTKMMTLYLAFEALRDRRLTLGTPIAISFEAASMPPSRLGLLPGSTLTAEEAILALITKSANDAAAALGEHLGGGSEHRFAQLMTFRARSLGMTRTTFRNASGLPDIEQVSSARDMALLGRRLVQDFPDRYGLFSTPHFVHRGRTHWNHNRLLSEYDGTDGIKTGYVNDSGFNLVASAQRDGVRLVAAVFGGRTGRERDRHMVALLDQGFAHMGVEPRAPIMLAARPPATASRAEPAPARTFAWLGTARAGGLGRGFLTQESPPAARAGEVSRGGRPLFAAAVAGVQARGGPPTRVPVLPPGAAGRSAAGRSVGARSAAVSAAAARTTVAAAPAAARSRLAAARPSRIEQGDAGRDRPRAGSRAQARPPGPRALALPTANRAPASRR